MAQVTNTAPTTATPTPPTVIPTETPPIATAREDLDVKSHQSPRPSYEEVVSNAGLFMETLERLHKSMGSKFMVPKIGGKALDMHRLFVEVTSRGGLEMIIRERKWKDVIAVFNFPTTTTNASFILRKYYVSLLHHYEKVIFFQNGDSKISVAAGNPVCASAPSQPQVAITPTLVKSTKKHQLPASSSLQTGCSVTVKINGKFDNGYIVTASSGSEMLRGVLYHVPFGSTEPQNTFPVSVQRHSRKRSRKAMRDPSHPKSNRSGYNFFFAEQYARLKPLHSGKERAISKQIGYLWNKLTSTEKEVYQEKGAKDKERYRSEMLEYKKTSNAYKPK